MGEETESRNTMAHPERSRDVLEEHVFLNIERAKQHLERAIVELCRSHGVTRQQYNVLRILYVRGKLPSSDIAERLLFRSPDMTRLLKRMEDKDLVDRELSEEDRRVLLVTLTSKGKKTCRDIDEEMVPLHREQMDHLESDELATLNQLLEKLFDPE